MKKLYFILALASFVFACKEKAPVSPETTDFIQSLKSTVYGENASVTIQLKAHPFKHATDLSVDWGDGKTESINLGTDQSSADAVFTFTHNYAKNGTYKITFRAVNPITTNTISTDVSIINKVAEPRVDFSFQVLENGKVKFINLSPDKGVSYYWGDTKTQNRSRLENPEFIYERNDSYSVFLRATDKFGQSTTTIKNVDIANAVPRDVANFKGVIFNENYDFSENDKDCKTILSEADPLSTKITNAITLNSAGKKIDISLVGMFHVAGSGNPEFNTVERFEKFRQYLTPGVKKIGVQTHDQWNAAIKYEAKDGSVVKLFSEVPNSLVEITDVKEIDQPTLFDGVYKQSFWVTFRLKADFQGAGKIDGTLKIRYLVYKMI